MSGNAAAIFAGSRDAGPLAAVDPRARLLAALVFLAALSLLHAPQALAAALGIAAAAAVLARLPARETLRRLAAVEGFLLFLLVSLPFTAPGTPVFAVSGLSASWEGLWLALRIAARVNAGLLAIAALLSTMGTIRLAAAMAGIGMPAALAGLFQLTVRYVGIFHEEFSRLRRAMRARAFRAGSNLHSWRTLGQLLGMMVLRGTERAHRVARAMRCRGFAGTFPALEQRSFGAADAAFVATWAGLAAMLLVLETLA